ncbi:MAG: glycosyl transferase [Rhodobacterales bacterium]|nr:MAG: glycosyl transferase [Rhodobacterales bacterium]
MTESDLAIVFIGRNEGARLQRCLASLQGVAARLVYVDSGSSDDSLTHARAAGAKVVELSTDRPFTAARARNAGFEALENPPEFVQFIDGDCAVQPGWLKAGRAALKADPALGIVTGWRSEMHRDRSVYNALCDFEWHRPAGEILACGGDMMLRSRAFTQTGGFNETVIAAEDDEFCTRIRKAGWTIRRLPLNMTLHDAAMTRFGEWWRRAVRSGHGFAQVGALHPEYFRPERKRVLVFGAILPLLALLSALFFPYGLLVVAAAYLLSYIRTVQGLKRENLPGKEALHHGLFLLLSKFPNLVGMAIFYWRRLRGHKMNIIEYK